MRPNRLRELLRARKPSLGTHIHSAWPATVELAGHSGMFDYIEFAGEYAPYDLFALENLHTYPCVARRLEEGSLHLHGWFFKIANAELFFVVVRRRLDQTASLLSPGGISGSRSWRP